jgi:hypothetical protein
LEATALAGSTCVTGSLPVSLTLHPGLRPPFTWACPGLPPGAEIVGLPDTLGSAGTWSFEVTGLEQAAGPVSFAVEVVSAAGTVVSAPVEFEVTYGGVWLPDADGDGYGDAGAPVLLCHPLPGYVTAFPANPGPAPAYDCDDASALIYPGAPEICDGLDNDCNGVPDDAPGTLPGPGSPLLPWYRDTDADGYGTTDHPTFWTCAQPPGYSALPGDCNDYIPWIYPGAPPTASGVDNNCDGAITGNEWPPCSANFNQDMGVSSADLLIFLAQYGCQGSCLADLDGNGYVASGDLLIILAQIGKLCGTF